MNERNRPQPGVADQPQPRRTWEQAAQVLGALTGLGDGLYPVEARFEEAEGTMQIAEIRVRFLPHPVIGYELPR